MKPRAHRLLRLPNGGRTLFQFTSPVGFTAKSFVSKAYLYPHNLRTTLLLLLAFFIWSGFRPSRERSPRSKEPLNHQLSDGATAYPPRH